MAIDKETFYDLYKLKRLSEGLDYVSEEEFEHRRVTDDIFKQELTDMGLKKAVFDMPTLQDDDMNTHLVEPTKKDKSMKHQMLTTYIKCKSCHETKPETDFSRVRGGKRQSTCKICIAQRISDGHHKYGSMADGEDAISHHEEHMTILDGTSNDVGELPLLKPSKPFKAIPEDVLHEMLLFAYKQGYEDGTASPEMMNKAQGRAYVKEFIVGVTYEM